ncbi:MAG: hypothetical protein K0Q71_3389 [Thermomicrobiales bacterium]|jgi:hypothetical protein|nr:hypothetical protein [Thermomicrobiales bacterium]
MGVLLDRLAMALASGASRRTAVGGFLAGMAAAAPWTEAAKSKKKRRRQRKKQRRRAIARYVDYCQSWCDERFEGDEEDIQACISAAEKGKGPCYSAAEQGPGHFCLRVKKCGKRKYCCPEVGSEGDPVTDGSCCPKGTFCAFINGTVSGNLCVE